MVGIPPIEIFSFSVSGLKKNNSDLVPIFQNVNLIHNLQFTTQVQLANSDQVQKQNRVSQIALGSNSDTKIQIYDSDLTKPNVAVP